ncbi:hypothetical protein BU16DRAFT_329097 [Lophium mytilinum]|uniref:Uncharacterized protein n=1 Tax=Lophium mytilinum TaxID=390894 RepID=A0A6A6QZP2_9PEZI|nr:hypothetical protein BU16DRAFT_329097 [Lophium mytilinum]
MAVSILCRILTALAALQIAVALNIPSSVEKSYIQPSRRLSLIATSKEAYLNLELRPRNEFYYQNETTASFIVDTSVNYEHRGSPFTNKTFTPGRIDSVPFTTMKIQITNTLDSMTLVAWSDVAVNSMSNEFAFNLSSLAPKASAYPVNIIGISPDGIQSYYATSSITVLLAGELRNNRTVAC